MSSSKEIKKSWLSLTVSHKHPDFERIASIVNEGHHFSTDDILKLKSTLDERAEKLGRYGETNKLIADVLTNISAGLQEHLESGERVNLKGLVDNIAKTSVDDACGEKTDYFASKVTNKSFHDIVDVDINNLSLSMNKDKAFQAASKVREVIGKRSAHELINALKEVFKVDSPSISR